MSIAVNTSTTNPYAAASANTSTTQSAQSSAAQTSTASNLAVPEDVVSLSGQSSDTTKAATYTKPSSEFVAKLKEEVAANYNYMKQIVEGLITKQGKKINDFSDLANIIRGKDTLVADAATISEAKSAISEDGYWGVNQTAGRIIDFAKALSGGDINKLAEIRDAVEQGFAAAKQALGLKKNENLPDISMKTYEKIMAEFDSWEAQGSIPGK